MNNIPTKEELDAKTEEVYTLRLKELKAKRVAAQCEEEYKEMRYLYWKATLSQPDEEVV